MSAWLASIKLALSGLLAALPTLRRGKAEREAGKSPHSVPKSHFDDLFNGAIKRLGAVSYDDSLWEQFKTNVGATFVRPDDFWRTNIRGWLSRPEVNAALGNLVKAHLVSAPESPSDYETLVSSYLLLSEEPKSSAEHYVSAAVTFLKASIRGAVKDSGVAAILQAGLGSMHDRFDELIDTRTSFISEAIAVHHGEDAENTLNAILKRRATHGYDVLAELNELARCISNDGKFSSAPRAIKAKVYDWIVRLAASSGQMAKAEEALTKLTEIGSPASPIALAWVEAARGEIDAALRLVRSIETAEGRSTLFGILRVKKDAAAALAYLDSQAPHTPDMFTPMGWVSITSCLTANGRLAQVTELLSTLPAGMILECPLLGYIRGLVYMANSVPADMQEMVLNESYLLACDHLLEGSVAENWRNKAYHSLEECLKAARETGDKILVGRAENLLQWLRLVDPLHKKDELVELIKNMADGKAAVDLMPLAVSAD